MPNSCATNPLENTTDTDRQVFGLVLSNPVVPTGKAGTFRQLLEFKGRDNLKVYRPKRVEQGAQTAPCGDFLTNQG